MKDKIRKIAAWRPGPGLYAAAAAAALVLLLYPLLRLTAYAVPWYDDYNYGRFAKTAMEEAPTWGNALKGAAECIRTSWYAWQGTYGSILLMVLMPGIWGEEFYRFGPLFLILFLTACVWTLAWTLSRVVLRADRAHGIGLSCVCAGLAVLLIHSSQAGFYWYNGGVHYVGMHGFAMLLVAVSVRLLYEAQMWRRILWVVLGTALSALVAGGNFVTGLQGGLVLLSIAGVGGLLRRRQTFWMLPMLAAYAVGFYLNVSAPGNDKRAASYVGWGMSPVKAVLFSFVEGAKQAWEFTGFMTLVLLAFLLPLAVHMVRRTEFPFRWPGLVSLWSVCLYATGFTPSLYSLGHGGLGRTLNAVKLTWQMLLVLNVVYWCGWILGRRRREGRMCRWWVYPVLAALAFAAFWAEPNQAGSFSSYGAYYYIHTGEAYNFYQEYLARVELLKSDADPVVLPPYRWKPWMICMGDLSGDPEDESNHALAVWYGKDAVICAERAEGTGAE
ncbi:MAG: hypothetical protein NC399_00215 [Muribaculum sp.]|nr:hypothetical protein [Muribaculum sp.]